MGYLDHSTNNIIVDAVLTDVGREFLARNDGSFSIVKFALGDDEVDYLMIPKFGRTVGKEKIEKNTPVFEAQTNAGLALKYRSVSISNPNLVYMPTVTLTSTPATITSSKLLSMTRNGTNSSTSVTFTQTSGGASTVDPELRDQAFVVRMANQFLSLTGFTPDFIDRDGVATYILAATSTAASSGGSTLTLNLTVRTLTDTQFTVYGDSASKSYIASNVSVSGVQSGTAIEFETRISNS
jgi:hypothetical protein